MNLNKEQILDQINNFDSDKLVQLNNIYCQQNSIDSEIYYNDEDFFDTFFGSRPFEVARAISFGDYEFSAEWVRFNGYGNLETIRFITKDELCELVDVIADSILEAFKKYEHLFEDVSA